MSVGGSAKGPAEQGSSWASETLPLAVRKELLAGELRRLRPHGAQLRRPLAAPGAEAAGEEAQTGAPDAPPGRPRAGPPSD